ncbi:MAG: glycosyltransferase, partial [Alphaproteobacteria bacterium]|nr:glycosyltransferase [Alphaproteobacteria bacterium]
MEKSVGIVVVTFNRLALLKEVVESLRKQTYNDFQIVIINNGSTDDTLQWLEKQTDIITIT